MRKAINLVQVFTVAINSKNKVQLTKVEELPLKLVQRHTNPKLSSVNNVTIMLSYHKYITNETEVNFAQ